MRTTKVRVQRAPSCYFRPVLTRLAPFLLTLALVSALPICSSRNAFRYIAYKKKVRRLVRRSAEEAFD